MQIPDLTKIAWQLNVAFVGAIFSVFSLIYNEKYIYYGFLTFLFGVISHMVDLMFNIKEDKSQKRNIYFVVQFILTALWLLFSLKYGLS